MSQINHELARCEWWIADLEARVAAEELRPGCEGGVVFGPAKILGLMVQTLESWRERKRVLQRAGDRARGG